MDEGHPSTHGASCGLGREGRKARARRVAGVFADAAGHYDLMNDVMSLGAHRLWKRRLALLCAPAAGERWLDLSCGTGDMAALLAVRGAAAVACDPSAVMLDAARGRLGGAGIPTVLGAAESLPFADRTFDGVCCSFGMRNLADLGAGLGEARRCLRAGGRFLGMEFSRPCAALRPWHERYLLEALPALGRAVAGDESSYRYLGGSIIDFMGPQQVAEAMRGAGLELVSWSTMALGAVTVHRGWRTS